MNSKAEYNQQFYDSIWHSGDIQDPRMWPHWDIIKDFEGKRSLEIGPGNYPKIKVKDNYFLDISSQAINKLNAKGGKGFVGDISKLPFEDNFFDLIVAVEIIEHVKDDKKAFFEIVRTLKNKGFFLFSVPLNENIYNDFDSIVGHERRYDINELINLLSKNDFKIIKYRGVASSLKTFNKFGNSFFIPYLAGKVKDYIKKAPLPKHLVNFYPKTVAFFEKIGIKKWQTDIDNLSKYKGHQITLLCQKEL